MTETNNSPDAKRVNIPTRYTFTDPELIELAKRGVQFARQYEALDKDFTSLKADFKLRLTNLENERARLDEKIADGFEMRGTDCLCAFNTPTKGQKTFTIEATGEVVRSEPMTPLDNVMDLPLKDEPAKEAKVLPDDVSTIGADVQADRVHFSSGAIGTNLGDALGKAAAGTDQPQVLIPDFNSPDWGAKTLRNEFKKACVKAGWPVAAIETLLSQCKGSDVAAIRKTLAPHVRGAVSYPVEGGVEGVTFSPGRLAPWGDFNGTHHLSVWGMLEPLSKVTTEFPDAWDENEKLGHLCQQLTNAALNSQWPDAAKQYLAHCIDGATLEELIALAERLKGSEVQDA